MISSNINRVLENIEASCIKAKRAKSEVKLIAVSKTKPVEMLMEAYNAGVRIFGENYVQELAEKIEVMPKDIEWHMIGHLQRNKVKYIIGKVAMIHSVDSLRLAEEINKQSISHGIVSNILIEVNVANEENKFGLQVDEVEQFVREVSQLKGICVHGFMTSAPFTEKPEENRVYFNTLHQLYIDIKAKNIDNICIDTLSMGMTNDYEIAVEAGATCIRVGTAIFGHRNYNK